MRMRKPWITNKSLKLGRYEFKAADCVQKKSSHTTHLHSDEKGDEFFGPKPL